MYAAYVNFEIGDNEYWAMLPFYAVENVELPNDVVSGHVGSARCANDRNFILLEPVAVKIQTYLFGTFWKNKLPAS